MIQSAYQSILVNRGLSAPQSAAGSIQSSGFGSLSEAEGGPGQDDNGNGKAKI